VFNKFLFAFAAAVVCLAVPAGDAAADRKVFLNGIDLQNVDVSDKKFDACTVSFDADGNVHITAPGFEIRTRKAEGASGKAADKAEPRPATLTKRYFVANKGTGSGKVQFQVVLYVNGTRVKTVRPGDADGVSEITKHLKAGANEIKVVAVKDLGKSGKRVSYSPKDEMEIILGEGTVDKGVVTIRRTVVQYERNASETGKFTDKVDFETR